jgi:hypothetical protein
MKTSEKSTLTVAVVNQQQIQIISNGEKLVPLRPICDALGIDFSAQLQRLKRDEILGSTMVIITTVGADKKDREMVTIPFKLVFGWLFTIDTSKVKPEAKEAVVRYKMECYVALYDHFTIHAEFAEWRQRQLKMKSEELKEVKANFNQAKERVKETEAAIDDIFKLNMDDYKTMKAQMVLEFPEEGGAE